MAADIIKVTIVIMILTILTIIIMPIWYNHIHTKAKRFAQAIIYAKYGIAGRNNIEKD